MALLSLLDTTEQERTQMTLEQTNLFLQCTMADLEHASGDFVSLMNNPQASGIFPVRVLLQRLQHVQDWQKTKDVTFEVSPEVVIMCAFLAPNVGSVVTWAYTLYCLFEKNGRRRVSMQDLAFAFPTGFPTEDGYHRIWRAQKGTESDGVDNKIDHLETWT